MPLFLFKLCLKSGYFSIVNCAPALKYEDYALFNLNLK